MKKWVSETFSRFVSTILSATLIFGLSICFKERLIKYVDEFKSPDISYIISGEIVDHRYQPVNNAHVGILGENYFTVSDSNGIYSITFFCNNNQDSLTMFISHESFRELKKPLIISDKQKKTKQINNVDYVLQKGF